jgi:hypothetical protein
VLLAIWPLTFFGPQQHQTPASCARTVDGCAFLLWTWALPCLHPSTKCSSSSSLPRLWSARYVPHRTSSFPRPSHVNVIRPLRWPSNVNDIPATRLVAWAWYDGLRFLVFARGGAHQRFIVSSCVWSPVAWTPPGRLERPGRSPHAHGDRMGGGEGEQRSRYGAQCSRT